MIAVSNALMAIAVVSAMVAVASAIMVAGALQKRGVPVNWVWLRVLLLSKYLNQYRDVTRQETGRTGPLFYTYVVAMNLALVTALVSLVLRAI
jgi:hypothetical protein